jgi:twitching motility protein PilT
MLRKKDLDRILLTMLHSQKGTSDLLFTPGKPLQVESSGKLVSVPFTPPIDSLTPFQTEMLTLGLLGGDKNNTETLVKTGSADCAYAIPEECRFRVNVFQQRRQYAGVLRKLSTEIMTMDELGLPTIFKDMAQEKNGLVLVTGATGSGKSTTLAALLNEMNETRPIHILTIEDPVEFVHPHKMATFNQRELGTDFDTFHSSLRAALRQAPKVILIGEMRDRETVDIGLAAASTGHLVLSTLHSIDCGQTINRIIGMFDKEEEPQIRARLNECLRYVVNQRLLPKKGGGRVASQEIMGMHLRVRELLLNGESEGKTFYDVISGARNRGWQTHDQAIADLFQVGKLDEETALAYGSNRPVLARLIDGIKRDKGIEDKDALQLSLDGSAGEVKTAFDRGWPAHGTTFPMHSDIGRDSRLIVYEPAVTTQGGRVAMIFPLKVQGTLGGINANNPGGEMQVSAATSGGKSAQVIYKNWSVDGISIYENDLTAKLSPVVKEMLPAEIQLANQAFTSAKSQALEIIARSGKFQHIGQLKALRDRATDSAEVDAISQTIKAIEERGA